MVRLSVRERSLYANLPFVLNISVSGFAEDPEPTVMPFEIDGAKVTYVGMSPSVRSSVTILNGRRSEVRQVTFVYQYRVEVSKPGVLEIPSITVSQGAREASSEPARAQVETLAGTEDMKVRLGVPERPVWVGETFPVTVDWYLRREPRDQQVVVPLFDLTDDFEVAAPEGASGQTLEFAAGNKTLQLPYERTTETLDGLEYTRFRFTANVTPLRPGTVEVPPTVAVARLKVGIGRDSFGFRTARTQLFRASSPAGSVAVKPLPVQGKPASFANAVGSSFSIKASASRTVVRVGEPIELAVEIRGDAADLDGLALPPLDGENGLPADTFRVADVPTTGAPTDDGRGKVFSVTVRLVGAGATEIPPIPFSYFDPARGSYQTVTSEPIALSVAGSAVVGADDVVGGAQNRTAPDPANAATASGPRSTSLSGADLSLSDPTETLDRATSVSSTAPWLALLYGLPLFILAGRWWQLRTRDERGEESDLRRAGRDVESALRAAADEPAREAAPRVTAALRALARAAGAAGLADDPVMKRLETEAFDPAASSKPLADDLVNDARALARRLEKQRRAGGGPGAAAAVVLLAGLVGPVGALRAQGAENAPAALEGGATGGAQQSVDDRLRQARTAYQNALEQQNRDSRARGFAGAESMYRALATELPGHPALLADWGNAALGARDLGRATLAFRRALALDPTLERARRNLMWVRENSRREAFASESAGAFDALLFWRAQLSRAEQHLVAGVFFAMTILLLVRWGSEPRPWLRRLALGPAVAWLVMLASVLSQPTSTDDVVVIADGVALRSADSPGAPAAVAEPLPAGVEARRLETRGDWVRIAAGSAVGWIQASAVADVVAAED